MLILFHARHLFFVCFSLDEKRKYHLNALEDDDQEGGKQESQKKSAVNYLWRVFDVMKESKSTNKYLKMFNL